MKRPQDQTRDNIRRAYGSVGAFARDCGLRDRRLVDMVILGERGRSGRPGKGGDIYRRLKEERLLVEPDNGDQAASG